MSKMPDTEPGLHVDVLDNGVFRADVTSLTKTVSFLRNYNLAREMRERAFARANAHLSGECIVCRCPRCRTDNQ